MKTRFRIWVTCMLLIAVLIPQVTYGWSAGGHRVVAMIAWRKMKPETRSRIAEILRKHPRLDDEFRIPQNIRQQGTDAENEWLFTQAAVWPDLIRQVRGYHHGTWHYVNFPYFLSELDKQALEGSLSFNLDTALPQNPDRANLNALQTIKLSTSKLRGEVSDAEKAIYLCWLSHVVGDLHQPLHTTALCSRVSFPSGDRGGNQISVTPNSNLHSYWDGLLGRNINHNNVRLRATRIIMAHEATVADAQSNLDPSAWAKEGVELCKDFVYSEEILNAVHQKEMGNVNDVSRVILSEEYKTTAGTHAQRRVALAGIRLAAILDKILGPDGGDPVRADLKIVGLLPDPIGADATKEAFRISNIGDEEVALEGWKLRDKNNEEFNLNGTIAAGETKKFVDTDNEIRLGNNGDEVLLINPENQVIDRVSYTRSQVRPGVFIEF